MDSPIFADLQGFVVGERFVAKEVAVLINGAELTHHIFRAPMAWNLLTKTEKTRACWLTANHHQFKWDDGHVDYGSAKRLIRDAIYRGTSPDLVTRIYVKGHEKKKWLLEILGNIAEDRDYILKRQNLFAPSRERTLLAPIATATSAIIILILYSSKCIRYIKY
ncbi:hypothetical protein ACFW04_013018 [Cataglyphis niger]